MNQPNVTLRQLRAFVAVAEHDGFAAAARHLHVTPSALSLLVKEIETVMDVRLFERTTRHIALTAAGSEFLPLARNLLLDLARAVENTRDLEQQKRGVIRIASTPLYSATLMPRLIRRYRERYPAITIYVLDSLNEEALNRVLTNEADLAIAPQRRTPPLLLQEPLLSDRMWFISLADHPLARQVRVTWAQILREPFVSLTRGFTTQLQSDLTRHKPDLVLEPAHNVSYITTALGMVQSGFGITAQPASALSLLEPFGLVARPLASPVVFRQLSLYLRSDREPPTAAQSFRQFLRSELRAG
jgi:DNA-binding transcriptional LysR family regulator